MYNMHHVYRPAGGHAYLHFMVLILEQQLNFLAFHCRSTLLRLCAMFHLVVGQYVLALPMYFVLVGDQVHCTVCPSSIFNGVIYWKFLYVQAAVSTEE